MGVADTAQSRPSLREVQPGEVSRLALILATALSETPMSKAMFPDPELRLRYINEIYEERLNLASGRAEAEPIYTDNPGSWAGLEAIELPERPGSYLLPEHMSRTVALTDGDWTVMIFSRGIDQESQFSEQLRFNRLVRNAHRAVGSVAFPQVRSALEWIGSAVLRPDAVNVIAIGTDPGHRGAGMARKIFGEVMLFCDLAELESVGSFSQPELRPFYESFGFKEYDSLTGSEEVPDTWLLRRAPRVL